MEKKTAIIIGAGPAGLTAAFELLQKTDIIPVIYEASSQVGGISRTVNYKGNRIDIGGHRFFSKSDTVRKWWLNILPLQGRPSKDDILLDRKVLLSESPSAPDPEKTDNVMLTRQRISRIFFLRHFFDYPIKLNLQTLSQLGIFRIFSIGISYLFIKLFPIKEEKSLEEFFINRFGHTLYKTFFKDYTEKVWGVPCSEIKPDWGAQRVKDLSILKALIHAVKSLIKHDSSIEQKGVSTSLIEQFMYPKHGPGQLWEEVAENIKTMGGTIYFNHKVCGVNHENGKIISVDIIDSDTEKKFTKKGDFFFSTMAVKDLINAFTPEIPPQVLDIANGLKYRDFITIGLLVKKLIVKNTTKIKTVNNIIPDNWIYVQERDVKLGRIQIFNNWSPYMVKDKGNVWLGLEYFCNEEDALWRMNNKELADLAIMELSKLEIIKVDDVLDHVIIKVEKTYPAYFGSYSNFDVIREFTDTYANLYLIGRNGMHRYNNMDHSMLTAMRAVQNIVENSHKKDNIWNINVEKDYGEEK